LSGFCVDPVAALLVAREERSVGADENRTDRNVPVARRFAASRIARRMNGFIESARHRRVRYRSEANSVFAVAISRCGGAPNIRAYSRLNCEGLS
jgi:hypothetical protein